MNLAKWYLFPCAALIALSSGTATLFAAEDENAATIGAAARVDRGVLAHHIMSPRQSGPTEVLVVLPKSLEAGRRYRVLYVLPVEAGRESRYGDPVAEILQEDLANKYGVICVVPTFADVPWYADHATDARIRTETYLLKDVIPFIDRTYPAQPERAGRYLVGFSKSGFGACSLLLRHPDLFEKAAAWDAPLMLDRIGKFGTATIFGTDENFAQYHLPSLVERRAETLRAGETPRIALVGVQHFVDDHRRFHERLSDLKIPHFCSDRQLDEHTWQSGWFAGACTWLLSKDSP